MYNKLLPLIGKKFLYLNQNWLLIDVMPELDSLILRLLDQPKTIQNNQYGSANRRTDEILTLKISDPDDLDYSDSMKTLLAGIIKK